MTGTCHRRRQETAVHIPLVVSANIMSRERTIHPRVRIYLVTYTFSRYFGVPSVVFLSRVWRHRAICARRTTTSKSTFVNAI